MINGKSYDKDIRKWIEKGKGRGNMGVRKFGYGIEKEWEGVEGGIDMGLSKGLVEGRVNKIKGVKREM